MTKVLLLISLLITTGDAFAKCPMRLEIGAKVSRATAKNRLRQLLMTHSAQLDPFVECIESGIDYSVAWSASSRRVSFVYTHDPKFRTENGWSVMSKIKVRGSELRVYPGWNIFGPMTPDGWRPVVGFLSLSLSDGSNDPWKPGPLPAGDAEVEVTILGFARHGDFAPDAPPVERSGD